MTRKRMTEKEILERLKKADDLLREYVRVVKPAAEELAKLKSQHVHGDRRSYSGDLGCFEAGINTVCLHTRRKLRDFNKERRLHNKAMTFERRWLKKTMALGLRHVYISGHF